MHITESDLFKGLEGRIHLDLGVMNEIADICTEEKYADRSVLFKENEDARNLYILEEGIVDLLIDEDTFIYSITERSDIWGVS